jgi:hypothetical protein
MNEFSALLHDDPATWWPQPARFRAARTAATGGPLPRLDLHGFSGALGRLRFEPVAACKLNSESSP